MSPTPQRTRTQPDGPAWPSNAGPYIRALPSIEGATSPPIPPRYSTVQSRVQSQSQAKPLARGLLPHLRPFVQRKLGPEPRLRSRGELATLELEAAAAETEEQRNKFLVLRLYEALNAREHAAVQGLLAPDLEWWFHGPPAHQHMMRILTGASSSSFRFVPRSVDAFGSTVIAEGPPATDSSSSKTYWVHAWTVGPDGVITQLREYFNTDLIVTRLAGASKCIWQSRHPDRARNSLPGLVLAL